MKDEELSDSKSHVCTKCSQSFCNLVDLSVHFNKKHERTNDKFECPTCTKKFRHLGHLKDHVKSVHLNKTLSNSQVRKIRQLKIDGNEGNNLWNSKEHSKSTYIELNTNFKMAY